MPRWSDRQLGPVVDRQPDPRRRRPAAARRSAGGKSDAPAGQAAAPLSLAGAVVAPTCSPAGLAQEHRPRAGAPVRCALPVHAARRAWSWRCRERCSGAAAAGPNRAGSLFRGADRPGQQSTTRRGSETASRATSSAASTRATRYALRTSGRSVSIYGQAIGEDEANGAESLLGSAAPISPCRSGCERGFFVSMRTRRPGTFGTPHRLGLAITSTPTATQLGDPLGHPPGRRPPDLGRRLRRPRRLDRRVDLHRGSAYPTASAGRARQDLGANAEVAWQAIAPRFALMYWRDPRDRTRAQLWWQLALP